MSLITFLMKGTFEVQTWTRYLVWLLKFSTYLFLWPVKHTGKILKSAGFHKRYVQNLEHWFQDHRKVQTVCQKTYENNLQNCSNGASRYGAFARRLFAVMLFIIHLLDGSAPPSGNKAAVVYITFPMLYLTNLTWHSYVFLPMEALCTLECISQSI